MSMRSMETSSMTISANALSTLLIHNSTVLRKTTSEHSFSGTSVATDDFASAVENPEDLLSDIEDDFKTQPCIPELDPNDSSDEETEETITPTRAIMSFTSPAKSPTKAPAVTTKPAPKPTPIATGEEQHVDAAAHVYEGVKGVWAWGKGVRVFSPFLGIAEAVASKVVGVAGTNLEDIDGSIKPQLKSFDNGLLNPAIENIVGIVLGAVGKTEDIIKPIIFFFLTPFRLIKEERKEETPEASPEVTAK
jgi:hypothetical protein